MYSLDSISNHTDATMLAYKPSASDAHCNLLGKRHTLLNHVSFQSLSNCVDESTSPLKRQKVATHINTRHVAMHFPHSSHEQNRSESSQSPPLSLQEPLANSSTERQSLTSYVTDMENAIVSVEDVSMDEIDIQPPNDYISDQTDSDISSINTRVSPNTNTLVHTLDSLVLDDKDTSNQVQSTSHVESRQESQSSNAIPQEVADSASDDDEIVAVVQVTKFFRKVQRWASTIQQICGDREKQLLYRELFGDKLAFTTNSPDLLKLLEEIDQWKNLVTLQEEHIVNLVEKIDKVLKTCEERRDWQIIRLATRILDNFYQRFQNSRFPPRID